LLVWRHDNERRPVHRDRIGGAAAIDGLVEAFYADTDAFTAAKGIRAMHGSDLGPVKAILKLYLAEWLGGPKDYSARRGHPRLRMRHAKFSIGPAERDAWTHCMGAALDVAIEDATLRERVRQELAKLADWVRNDPDNEHDKHH
jgi:hemoglobin